MEVAVDVLNSHPELSERGFHVFRRNIGGLNLNKKNGLMPGELKADLAALMDEGYMGQAIDLLQDFIRASVEAGRFTQEERCV